MLAEMTEMKKKSEIEDSENAPDSHSLLDAGDFKMTSVILTLINAMMSLSLTQNNQLPTPIHTDDRPIEISQTTSRSSRLYN